MLCIRRLTKWYSSQCELMTIVETWLPSLKAVTCLTKDRGALLTFYDLPAEHWDLPGRHLHQRCRGYRHANKERRLTRGRCLAETISRARSLP